MIPAPACPPEVLAGIADLELVARIVVEGLSARFGATVAVRNVSLAMLDRRVTAIIGPSGCGKSTFLRSPFHGYSAEFNQYRHYRPGDDLKYVDWKLVARTDRVYTRQFRETTNMASAIVLDTSGSMAFPVAGSERTRPVSKFRYAVIAAAALAHLISGQGDAVGLLAGEQFLPPRAGRQHLRGLLAGLSSLAPSGGFSAADSVRRASERLKRRGLLLVLSDFYDDEERTCREISPGTLACCESGRLRRGRTLAINAGLARRGYQDAVAAFLERWHGRAGAEGFQYSLIVTDTPPQRALRNVLLARS